MKEKEAQLLSSGKSSKITSKTIESKDEPNKKKEYNKIHQKKLLLNVGYMNSY